MSEPAGSGGPTVRAPRIGLLTPYTGGNLGDAAIQEAVIQNIRSRRPGAELLGITLAPERTAELHGIPSTALSGIHEPRRAEVAGPGGDPEPSPTHPSAADRLRDRLRAYRPLVALVRGAQHVVRAVGGSSRSALRDLAHTWRAWRVARGLDVLVVAGGGQLDEYWGGPWGQPYALMKWAFLTSAGSGRVVFLSVGAHALESRLSRRFVRVALDRAHYRSFRDEVSKRLAREMGARESDPVFPDLAFSLRSGSPTAGRGQPATGVIGVSPIAYLSPRIWPRHDEGVYRLYVQTLADFLAQAVTGGLRALLFISDECDQEALDDLQLEVKARLKDPDAARRIEAVPTPTLDRMLAAIRKTDCIVASRLHGILLSHLLTVPVVALSYDRKVDTYMGEMGMDGFRLDIHRFGAEDVLDRLHRLLGDRESVRARLAEIVARHTSRLDRQYDAVFGAGEAEAVVGAEAR